MTAILRQQQTLIEQYRDLNQTREHPKLALFKGNLVIYTRDSHSLIGTVADLVQRIIYQICSWWDQSLSFSKRAIRAKITQVENDYSNHCAQVAVKKFGLSNLNQPTEADLNGAFALVQKMKDAEFNKMKEEIAAIQRQKAAEEAALMKATEERGAIDLSIHQLRVEQRDLDRQKEALQAEILQQKADYQAWQEGVARLTLAQSRDSSSQIPEPDFSAISREVTPSSEKNPLKIQFASTNDLEHVGDTLESADPAGAPNGTPESVDCLSFLDESQVFDSSKPQQKEPVLAVADETAKTGTVVSEEAKEPASSN